MSLHMAAMTIQASHRARLARQALHAKFGDHGALCQAVRVAMRVKQVQRCLGEKGAAHFMIADEHGDLPVHHACHNEYPKSATDIMCYILDEASQCIEVRNKKGQLPLHLACLVASDVGIVEELLRRYPEAAEEKDGAGQLPMHSAIKNETPAAAAIVDAVLDANPEVIKDKKEWIEVRKFLMVMKKKTAE